MITLFVTMESGHGEERYELRMNTGFSRAFVVAVVVVLVVSLVPFVLFMAIPAVVVAVVVHLRLSAFICG